MFVISLSPVYSQCAHTNRVVGELDVSHGKAILDYSAEVWFGIRLSAITSSIMYRAIGLLTVCS